MKTAAPIAALGVAGLAHAHLRRAQGRIKPQSEAHKALAQLAGAPPCGAPALDAAVSGFRGDTFLSQAGAQREALIAHVGNLPGVSVPDLSIDCAKAWAAQWAAIQEQAAARDARVKATRTIKTAIRDVEKNNPVGRELLALGAVVFQQKGTREQFAADVTRRISALAAAMDSEIHIAPFRNPDAQILDDTLGNLRDLTRRGAQKTGDALAFTMESLVAPIFGAAVGASAGVLASSVGPYLVVGGAIYWIARRK